MFCLLLTCLLTVLLTFFCAPAAALQMRFDRVQLDEKLRDQGVGAIKSIAQDSTGFIWIAAEYGLVRYDGKQFTRYTADPTNAHALLSNYINDLLFDREGNMWVATDKGLNIYRPLMDHFDYLLPSETPGANNRVASMAVDRDNNLILARDEGIAIINATRDRVQRFDLLQADPNSHISVQIIYVDKTNTIWMGTKGAGAAKFDPTTEQFTFFRHDRNDPHSIVSDNIITIEQDLQGNLWFGSYDGGISRLPQGASQFHNYRYDANNPRSIADKAIWDIYCDSRGTVWLATDRNGLARYNPHNDGFDYVRHQAYNNNSLASNQVRALFEDKQGNLWVGLFPNGLNYYNRTAEQFRNYRHLPDNPASLSHSAVLSLYEDYHGTLWVGTEGGLNAFDRTQGVFQRYLHDPHTPTALQASAILSLLEDEDNNLWVGTWAGGAHKKAPGSNTFKQYKFNDQDPNSLSNNIIWAMVKDKKGRIWLGTEGGGLNLYRPETDDFQHFRLSPQNSNSINSEYIWTMMLDSRGHIWLGTTAGVSRFDPETFTFHNFPRRPGDPKAFRGERVRSFLEDHLGRIWIGTQDDGFYIFDPVQETFHHFNDAQKLPAMYITGFVQDNNHMIWATTTNGLLRIHPETMEMSIFNTSHGLASNNFYREANFIDRDGTLYFGSTDGFSVFHPDDLQHEYHHLPLVLTSFRIFNKPVPIAVNNSPLQKPIWLTQSLVLDHTDTMFSFEFSALEFQQGLHQEYAYKMEGFDQSWIYIGSERSATFTNLNPGRYTFKVKTGTNRVWRDDIAQVHVTILPAPWKTPAAYVLYVLLLVALILLIANTKIKQVQLASEREINRELKNLNNIKDSFLANTSHELRTPLNGIIGIAENLSDHFAGKDEYAAHHLHLISSSGKRLANLINDILDYSKLANRNLELYRRPIDMHGITETVFTLLAPLTVNKAIELVNEFQPDHPLVFADENRLQQILINLIGNGIKYSDNGSVSVGMNIKPPFAEIYVTDTGIGIDPAQTEAIFEVFSQLQSTSTRQYGGTGLGLAITRQLVELHGGRIWVESMPDKGSQFIFTLPLASEQQRSYSVLDDSPRQVSEQLRTPRPANVAAAEKKQQKPRNAQNFTILVVDDDAVNRMVLQGMLKQHDYHVLEAESGREAVDMVHHNPCIDLIIMDVMMPNMTGYEACRHIRQTHSFDVLPILFLTAKKNVDEDIEECFSSGGNDYMTKPVSKHDLLPRVANHLRIASLLKKLRTTPSDTKELS